MWGLVAIAQRDPFSEPEVIWGTAGLAVALLVGALLVYLADRWRKKQTEPVVDTASELTQFRQMFERGEITEEEYARLRDKVAQRVKVPPAATGLPAPNNNVGTGPAAAPPPAPDPAPPPTDAGKPANPPSSA